MKLLSVQGKLEGWKSKFLSFVGRHTLIKLVLGLMQTTIIPLGVCNKLEGIIRRFL